MIGQNNNNRKSLISMTEEYSKVLADVKIVKSLVQTLHKPRTLFGLSDEEIETDYTNIIII